MFRRSATLALLSLAPLLCLASVSHAQTYNAFDDFWGPTQPADNPWTYGTSSTWDGSVFNPMQVFGDAGNPTWTNFGTGDPNIIKVNFGFSFADPGDIHMHPGPGDADSTTIIRWQAPKAGTIDLTGLFTSRNSGVKEVRVATYGGGTTINPIDTELLTFTGQQLIFSGTELTVNTGEYVGFSVFHSYDNYGGDSTTLRATISYLGAPSSVPEPGSLSLLMGMGGFGSFYLMRRRK